MTSVVTPMRIPRTQHSWLQQMRAHAAASPDAVAVRESSGATITRAALVSNIDRAIAGLLREGFCAGDTALFSVRPGIAAVTLVLAVHELRGVLLPMDPGVSDALFEYRMQLLAPRWVFAESVLLTAPGGLLHRLLKLRGVQFAPLGGLRGARYIHVGMRLPGMPRSRSYESLLKSAPRSQTTEDLASHAEGASDDEPAFIVCTSGTTSHPKAVVHSRRSLRAIVDAVSNQLAMTVSDAMYARDLHLMLPALLAGARVVIPRDRAFDGVRALDLLERERVTHAFLVTRDCRLLLDACVTSGRRVPDSLRSLLIGAAPVRSPFLARLETVLPAHTVAWCVYGATEVLPVSCVSLREKVAYDGPGDLVGAVLPGLTVRVDEHGQLCVRGDRVFTGYAGESPVEEHCTGDLALIEHGRIVLLGRRKDMIIRGEQNIYPALYEPLVERIPGVRRAALVGDFDPVLADERVILVVEPDAGVAGDELIARVAKAVQSGPLRLDATAQPDRIIVAQLPESGRSHKIDKHALREMLSARSPCA